MTTARSVVYRSLRMLGIVDPEETPTATQADNALEALNAMVHGWAGQSVDVGHDDWTLDDDVTVELEPQHVEGMTALLCEKLLAEYPGASLSPAVIKMAADGWSSLVAAHFDSSVDSDLVAPTMFQFRGFGRWP